VRLASLKESDSGSCLDVRQLLLDCLDRLKAADMLGANWVFDVFKLIFMEVQLERNGTRRRVSEIGAAPAPTK
jgi:hypothetical protein